MKKIIKGDQVVVIAGKDGGKQGRVIGVLGDKVLVEGVNVVKRHQKPNPMRNIAILNPSTNKADRVGIKIVVVKGKTKRIRVFKSSGAEIPAVNRGV